MKRLILCAVLCVAPVMYTTGCKTGANQSVQIVSYKTLSSVQTGVKASLNTYGMLYRAGKLNQSQVDNVRAAYAKYQIARLNATDAAQLDLEQPASVVVLELATILTDIIVKLNIK